MTDTPRTDAIIAQSYSVLRGSAAKKTRHEIRQLERELAAVTADLEFRRELGALQQQEYDKVTAERDASYKNNQALVDAMTIDRRSIVALNEEKERLERICRNLEKCVAEGLTKDETERLRAERDVLKAKLATINHIAMSLFVRTTSSEVTGEMAEIGRLSRGDGQ